MSETKNVVRCAVIGLGMGQAHVRGYLETPEAQLVAVADLDASRLAKVQEQVGADNCFTDYKVMLERVKPDLVSVALPNFLHAPVTIECLRAGCHVLCEKPMAMSLKQAEGMKKEAVKAKKKLGINLSFRFTPQARALKDLCEEGFLGEVYHAGTKWTRREGFPGFGSWFGQKKMSGGGPLIDLGVHRIDLAMWLMGSPKPVSVSGAIHEKIGVPRGKLLKKQFDVEDFAAGFIRFDNGASLTLEISWGGHQAEPESMSTTVMGTKGTIVHRNLNGTYDFIGEYFTETKGHKLAGMVAQSRQDVRSSYGEMVRAIINDTDPLANAEDGLRVQQILDGLYKSAATGKEVAIK
ncbi:MAG TPA: Gfo/Idh/MocA family oxidoreductase [Tepidisphaeraceae bacterium]|jgi:predicted dehydrogenase